MSQDDTGTTTRRFQALGHDFCVRAPRALTDHVDRVFAALAADGEASHHYDLVALPVPDGHDAPIRWEVAFDGERLLTSHDRAFLYAYLCWHVNRQAVEGCDDLLLLHASAACDDAGRAVLLPAQQESGKTTTVAGLVGAGLSYLTDEAVALRPEDATVVAYPKPLSVDRGSWKVLAHLRPEGDDDLAPFLGSQWQVPGEVVGTVADEGRPTIVVSPSYDADADGVHIEAMTPGETLTVLAQNSFNLNRFGSAGFRILEGVARSTPGYRMRHSDLDAAVAEIRRLLAAAP